MQSLQFDAIGTPWIIQGVFNEDQTHLIQTRIATFDATWSRFRTDSLVTRMSQRAGSYSMPVDGYPLLDFYKKIYTATAGAVTPLIGQTIADMGYDAAYSFKPHDTLSKPPAWEDVITYDHEQLTVHKPALLDFGAAGKGYLVDIIHRLLVDNGSEEHTINAGGDILHYNALSLEVGLENPQNTNEAIGSVTLRNQSIAASSGAKRSWGAYQHIINPYTLRSPTTITGTWVIADTTMLADGLATALFFTSPAQLRKSFSFEYAMIDSTMEVRQSAGFAAQLFKERSA